MQGMQSVTANAPCLRAVLGRSASYGIRILNRIAGAVSGLAVSNPKCVRC